MVDCRPVSGAAPPAPDSTPPAPADPQPAAQQGPGGDVGSALPAAPAPATVPAVRASTPAAAPPLNTYSGMPGGGYPPLPPYGLYGGGGCGVGGPGAVKGGANVVLCAPPPLAPLPPPPNINTAVHKSVQANGSDLPMNDMPTLRYFFNLGVDLMWSSMYPPPQLLPPLPHPPPHAPPPPLPHPPPRYYSPVNELTQELQQGMALHDRPSLAPHNGDHKSNANKAGGGGGGGGDKALPGQNKGNGQRTLLGPRFNRGNGEGNHSHHNHGGGGHQNNKNSYNNKGRMNNNRRNAHGEGGGRAGAGYGPPETAECGSAEPTVYSVPYVQYPPPIYHYYPDPSDPGMMGMMGGVGYMGYMGEELAEHYSPAPLLPPYYPPYQPHHPQHPPAHHHEHK